MYLCSAFATNGRITYAEIAQLVEHNLAKVGVASSSLVFRSEGLKKAGNKKQKTLCINDMQGFSLLGGEGRSNEKQVFRAQFVTCFRGFEN